MFQKESIHGIEYSCIGADTQRQRQNRDRAPFHVLSQHSYSVVNVARERFKERNTTALANLFLGGLNTAELDACCAARFIAGHARPDVVIDLQLQIGFDLLSQVTL